MTPEVYLIAPSDAEAALLADRLTAALATPGAAALLLPRGDRDSAAYAELVRAVAPVAQAANVAVLIEGDPALVSTLDVDGLHVTGGVRAVREAIEVLKPDYIVGVGDVRSRHDAMQKGEAGIDYILFGPLSGSIDAAQRELARWWAETMEIPSVLSDPDAIASASDAAGCEFIGLSLLAREPVE